MESPLFFVLGVHPAGSLFSQPAPSYSVTAVCGFSVVVVDNGEVLGGKL